MIRSRCRWSTLATLVGMVCGGTVALAQTPTAATEPASPVESLKAAAPQDDPTRATTSAPPPATAQPASAGTVLAQGAHPPESLKVAPPIPDPTRATTSASPRRQAPAVAEGPALVPVEAPIPPVKISAKVGRGVTFSFGDYFSLGLRGRMMLRYTFLEHNGTRSQEFTLRRARLYMAGHAFSRNILYYFHVAFANQDFEPDSRNPLYDANITLTHLRDFQILIGQQLVPFSRDRVISSNNAELVDRSIVNAELQLDRDVGVQLFSNDLGGLGGRLGYAIFIGTGDGRNQLAGNMGLLYVARLEVRPMGAFSDYTEADLDRTPSPKLSIGIAGAYNHDAVRPMGTLKNRYTLGNFDYVHGTADLIFKYRGFSFLSVGNLRWAKRDRYDGVDANQAAKTEYSRSAAGYSVQAGFIFPHNIGVAARWSQLFSMKDSTDPSLIKTVKDQGKELIGALSWYIRGHTFKLQADYAYLFGDTFSEGRHQARVQVHVGY